jgi:hypothetical protein
MLPRLLFFANFRLALGGGIKDAKFACKKLINRVFSC